LKNDIESDLNNISWGLTKSEKNIQAIRRTEIEKRVHKAECDEAIQREGAESTNPKQVRRCD
jgi:hypothetical protein